MRRHAPPSELARLAEPLGRLADAAWRRMHWWVSVMACLYAVSGITIIRPDQVAVVLRWGRLLGATPATRIHGPGLLFAMPPPIDRVVRVSTRRVRQIDIETLAQGADYTGTLDPLTVGYALSGDQNIVHASVEARYRVSDPVAWAFYGPRSDVILRTEVTAAMVASIGEMRIDDILSDGRKTLTANAQAYAQAGLDAAHAGLQLVNLELTRLSPPAAVAPAFDAVQSAYIDAETARRNAQAYAQELIPRAQARADARVKAARAAAATALARARAGANAFVALDHVYRNNPRVVRERLYRTAVEKAFARGAPVRWVPPQGRGRLRLVIAPAPAGAAPSPEEGSSGTRGGAAGSGANANLPGTRGADAGTVPPEPAFPSSGRANAGTLPLPPTPSFPRNAGTLPSDSGPASSSRAQRPGAQAYPGASATGVPGEIPPPPEDN